ncbi:MAG TPA: hypothetical protein VIY29_21130, partial [Ktedonobacteraceae bacterium]
MKWDAHAALEAASSERPIRSIPFVSLLAADSRRIGNGAGQEKCPGSGRKRSIVMTQTDPKT